MGWLGTAVRVLAPAPFTASSSAPYSFFLRVLVHTSALVQAVLSASKALPGAFTACQQGGCGGCGGWGLVERGMALYL